MNSVESIWLSIKAVIAWMGLRIRVGKKCQVGDDQVLLALSIPMKPLKWKQVHLVHWQKLVIGWFKLNVDGSCLGYPGRMGAGGVIRDEDGILKLAFAECLDLETNNSAELLILFHGLMECRELGIQRVEVELDSLLIVDWLEKKKKGRCGIWYLEDYWEEIQ